MYQDLKGNTALVTGAGKKTGIGYAVAKKLAENGVNLVIADLVNNEALKSRYLGISAADR